MNSQKKIIFMGTAEFAIPSLEKVIKRDLKIMR